MQLDLRDIGRQDHLAPPLMHTLLVASQRLFGTVLLLAGILMISTLVLAPIGLPLALFALALILSPEDHE
jgi:hypothetical protein